MNKDSLGCSIIGMAKFAIAGFVTLVFRLITPFLGLSNINPLMATELAGAKAYGPFIGGLYGASSMIVFDALTSGIGPWTWNTSICYGLIGVFGSLFMKGRPAKIVDFMIVSIIGTLFFDLTTGIIPTLIDGRTAVEALVLQAPFTVRHLGGNIFFALFAPWFYRNIMANLKFELLFMAKTA
ncbi:MAG: ECF transporter S component [Candidatus Taylorbacteria bacterium]|nr:ECF transporter S component [Candidatus Taylorbacteria bacterium]